MKLLGKLNQLFGFTAAEQRIVMFLAIVFVAGLIIRMFHLDELMRAKYDYSALDSEFIARSSAAAAEEPVPQPPSDNSSSVVSLDVAAHSPSPVQLTNRSIDLNTASKTDLVRLPGIGEAIAARIISYRTEHGGFTSLDGLMKVKGIGKKKFERIAPYLTIGK